MIAEPSVLIIMFACMGRVSCLFSGAAGTLLVVVSVGPVMKMGSHNVCDDVHPVVESLYAVRCI